MPNVPNVPGVPALSSYATTIQQLLASDDITVFANAPQQWGLYLDGAMVVTADTVSSFDYKQEWVISDYPIERGAFESYDKVQTPFEVRIRFVMGGSEADRQALLSSISAIAGTLDLFDAVTPEATYTNVNISHYDYSREANRGLGLLVVDVWCAEVRIAANGAPTALSNTQSPSGMDAVGGGSVQPSLPTLAQSSTFSGFTQPAGAGVAFST